MSTTMNSWSQELENQLNAIVADITSIYATFQTLTGPTGLTALAIGSDKPKVACGAFRYRIAGKEYAKAADTVGTALSGSTLPDVKYGAWALEIDAAGTVTINAATGNAAGYASSALAIAGIAAVVSTKARMGIVTVLNAGATFIPGTTNLDAGTATAVYIDGTTIANLMPAQTAVAGT